MSDADRLAAENARLHNNISTRIAKLEKRIEALERAAGKQGNGSCFCKVSPWDQWRNAHRMIEDPRLSKHYPMSLDHRCPIHGETAQPKLWGRHKEKELLVTWAQWDSLGIAYTTQDEQTKQPFDHAGAMAAAKART